MSKIAVVFPGQASHYPGMLQCAIDFANPEVSITEISSILGSTREILGYDPLGIDRDEEKLSQTSYAQPMIFLTSVIPWMKLRRIGIAPDYIAGHSLGEFSAICAAGIIDMNSCLELVRKRAQLMAKACEDGSQGMWAVLGGKTEDVKDKVRGTSQLYIVNYNCPGQVVLSGSVSEFQRYEERLNKVEGVKKIAKLGVSGAFHHSIFMNSASAQFGNYLRDSYSSWINPDISYVLNFSCPEHTQDKEEVYCSLLSQMIRPVCWQQMVEYMLRQGVDTFIEIPPKEVLTGFIKRIAKASEVEVNVINQKNISEYLATLQ